MISGCTSVIGKALVKGWAARYFLAQGHGRLVGISSPAKYLCGRNSAYFASKSFETVYLKGLRLRLEKEGITVTEILPVFVITHLTEDKPNMFWAVPSQKVAKSIFKAISKKKRVPVLPQRWKPFYCLLPHLPFWFLKKVL